MRFLEEKRGTRNQGNLPSLTEEQILKWADAHEARTGKWPKIASGPVSDAPHESWSAIANALVAGLRGLPAGSSLPKLLDEKRRSTQPAKVTAADGGDHPPVGGHSQRAYWRLAGSDFRLCYRSAGETWANISMALRMGLRRLPGNSSLSQLLAEKRGVSNSASRPPLTIGQILSWADKYHERTGSWPKAGEGDVPEAPGENWANVDAALQRGGRNLQGNWPRKASGRKTWSTEWCGPTTPTEEQILRWADAHHEQTGLWPKAESGDIPEAAGERWKNIDVALQQGQRGLPGGSSLPKLLAERRQVRHRFGSPLTVEQVLTWADEHHKRTGSWPKADFGPIPESPGETWRSIDRALQRGTRGFATGSSLAKLLEEKRGVRHRGNLPPLTEEQVFKWAAAHKKRTGRWPSAELGIIIEAPEEKWTNIDAALRIGIRGFRGGSSLSSS